MNKIYNIFLDSILIGISELENADASCGVVFGKIKFKNDKYNFDFFQNFCLINNVTFTEDIEDKLIMTNEIKSLQVFNDKNIEIVGLSSSISGMDDDGFDITILGVPYPFYGDEFPHHIL